LIDLTVLLVDESLSTDTTSDTAVLNDLAFAVVIAVVEDSTADTNCDPVAASTKPEAARFDAAVAAFAVAASNSIAAVVAACFKVATATIAAVISPSATTNAVASA
jgi:hypothetical protein